MIKECPLSAKTSWHVGKIQCLYRRRRWLDDLSKMSLRVNGDVAFIICQNTCHICHAFDLQADNIADSFKRSNKVRYYKCTRNDDDLLSSTEFHVVREGNNVIGGIVSARDRWYCSKMVRKRCKIKTSAFTYQRKIWSYRNKKARKKFCEATFLYFNIARTQQILLQALWNGKLFVDMQTHGRKLLWLSWKFCE